MTLDFAITYIPRRMKELGHTDNYFLQLRHLVLPPKGKTKLHMNTQLLLLIEPADTIAIKSDSGVYDTGLVTVNELQYEHQGTVSIKNHSVLTQHVRFIQVIPNNNQPCPSHTTTTTS